MRILILSCSTGEGHNSCAKAIKGAAERRGDLCVIQDTLQFISDGAPKFISDWHARLYRYFPKLSDGAYSFAQEHSGQFNEQKIYRLLKGCIRKLRTFIQEGRYDAVICVHLFPAMLLTVIQRERPLNLRTGFLATDYTASPGCDRVDLDRFFIPHEAVAGEFLDMGVPEEKLLVTGIPVRQNFYSRMEKRVAKEAAGICPDHRHLLVMSGSMGAGPIAKIVEDLARMMDERCELTVVCGTNKRLKQQLEQKMERLSRANIHILGFVQDIPLLMDSADLYLTKPGGISTSEAWVKGLPMVLVDAVAGCEEPNLRFFTAMGGAATAEKPEELAELCLRLLTDPERTAEMERALAGGKDRNAAELICRFAAGEIT